MSHRGHAGCAIFLTSVATICTTQLTRSAQNQLHAPGFVAYLHIALMSLMLPLAWLIRKEGGRILASVKDVAMFLPLWVISNYCLVQALALAPAGLVQCLFGTSPAQVCLLSRIFLHEPFTFWRLLAIAFAFGGVLALAAHSHFQGDSAMDVLLGTLCGLSAVVAAACYKVAFKVRLGTPPVYVVLGVVGTLGFVAAFLGLPLVVLLAWLNVEDRWWSSSVPVDWPLVLGSAGCDIIYNTALAWGLAVTSPVFIAVGVNVGTPVNMLVDALLHGFWPSIAQYCGTLLIAVSFVILVLGPADRPVPEAEQSLTLART
ncbi:unnamed protein product [Durusdinium trenchii]|uniref:Uncharacterized protein n=2 Tax=Durusdinium trenchii TaxID=1381693 RepID=A0ABP0QRX0_9DINO